MLAIYVNYYHNQRLLKIVYQMERIPITLAQNLEAKKSRH